MISADTVRTELNYRAHNWFLLLQNWLLGVWNLSLPEMICVVIIWKEKLSLSFLLLSVYFVFFFYAR